LNMWKAFRKRAVSANPNWNRVDMNDSIRMRSSI